MATIVLTGFCDPQPPRMLMALQKVTGLSLAEVKRSLSKSEPLVTAELFMNDHEERDAMLLEALEVASQHGVSMRIFEFPSGQEPTAPLSSAFLIDQSTLRNILANF